MTINEKLIGVIRTGVPALIGSALALLIAKIPAVADIIAAIDGVLADAAFGVTLLGLIQALSVAAVIAGYYWVARKVGAKYPALEKWLLGSSVVPTYVGVDSGFRDNTKGL